jgi:hypothetical protein
MNRSAEPAAAQEHLSDFAVLKPRYCRGVALVAMFEIGNLDDAPIGAFLSHLDTSSGAAIGDQQTVEHAFEGFLRHEHPPADPDHRDFPAVGRAISSCSAHAEQFSSLFHSYRKFNVIAFRHGARS